LYLTAKVLRWIKNMKHNQLIIRRINKEINDLENYICAEETDQTGHKDEAEEEIVRLKKLLKKYENA
jgi:hypothetical protein